MGEAARLRQWQQRRLPLILALTALLFSLHLLQWGLERAAQGRVESGRQLWSATDREFGQASARLAAARRVHPARYLAGQTLDGVPEQLEQARTALERATRARHPDEKRRLAAAAETAIRAAQARVEAVEAQLDRLDSAKTGYAEAARRLEAAIPEARRTIAALEEEGYRAEHFAPARTALAAAESRAEEVHVLQERGHAVPYLEIYDKSREGQARAEEAIRLARGVAALRQTNDARARELLDRIAEVRRQYGAARVAGARLAFYTAYAHQVAEVERCVQELDAAADAAREAARANGMERQAFREAAALLDQGERQTGRAAEAFARAVETKRLLVAALAALVALRSAATDDVDHARRAIDRYDDLDQEAALRLLNQAAQQFRSAETLRHTDPILAVEAYRQARALASQARRSVRTAAPSSGGGWSGGGGSSGGGSSGPSGGSYGGPSGGSYGGPSGGSHGSGGF